MTPRLTSKSESLFVCIFIDDKSHDGHSRISSEVYRKDSEGNSGRFPTDHWSRGNRREKLRWPRELNMLQLKKTLENRRNTSKLRKHNQMQKQAAEREIYNGTVFEEQLITFIYLNVHHFYCASGNNADNCRMCKLLGQACCYHGDSLSC